MHYPACIEMSYELKSFKLYRMHDVKHKLFIDNATPVDSKYLWATVSGFSSWCQTFLVRNQPATQGQLSLPSLWGR